MAYDKHNPLREMSCFVCFSVGFWAASSSAVHALFVSRLLSLSRARVRSSCCSVQGRHPCPATPQRTRVIRKERRRRRRKKESPCPMCHKIPFAPRLPLFTSTATIITTTEKNTCRCLRGGEGGPRASARAPSSSKKKIKTKRAAHLFTGSSSGTARGRPGRQTSWAPCGAGRPQGGCGRTTQRAP